LRKLHRYCFAAFVVLHGDHGRFDGVPLAITFEPHAIVEFEGQSGKKNGEIGCTKL
jgi:hypothetical protein